MTHERPVERLIFVYDADSHRWSALVDGARKLLTLKGCALCRITHGIAGEKEQWKSCKEELGIPVDYKHRDDLDPELRRLVGDRLPSVVAVTGTERVVLLTPDVLDRCKGSVSDFKGRLSYHAALRNLTLGSPSGAPA